MEDWTCFWVKGKNDATSAKNRKKEEEKKMADKKKQVDKKKVVI